VPRRTQRPHAHHTKSSDPTFVLYHRNNRERALRSKFSDGARVTDPLASSLQRSQQRVLLFLLQLCVCLCAGHILGAYKKLSKPEVDPLTVRPHFLKHETKYHPSTSPRGTARVVPHTTTENGWFPAAAAQLHPKTAMGTTDTRRRLLLLLLLFVAALLGQHSSSSNSFVGRGETTKLLERNKDSYYYSKKKKQQGEVFRQHSENEEGRVRAARRTTGNTVVVPPPRGDRGDEASK